MAKNIRYTDDQKKAALQSYVDNDRNLTKASNETGIPYNTFRPWLASDWGKIFMANYELETKGELVAGATKEVLEIGVERYKTEAEFIAETEKIMCRVIKRMNELIGNEKNLKSLTELFKALNEVLTQFRSKSDEKDYGKSAKADMIIDLIDRQMIVRPPQLEELLKNRPRANP